MCEHVHVCVCVHKVLKLIEANGESVESEIQFTKFSLPNKNCVANKKKLNYKFFNAVQVDLFLSHMQIKLFLYLLKERYIFEFHVGLYYFVRTE